MRAAAPPPRRTPSFRLNPLIHRRKIPLPVRFVGRLAGLPSRPRGPSPGRSHPRTLPHRGTRSYGARSRSPAGRVEGHAAPLLVTGPRPGCARKGRKGGVAETCTDRLLRVCIGSGDTSLVWRQGAKNPVHNPLPKRKVLAREPSVGTCKRRLFHGRNQNVILKSIGIHAILIRDAGKLTARPCSHKNARYADAFYKRFRRDSCCIDRLGPLRPMDWNTAFSRVLSRRGRSQNMPPKKI